MSLKCFRVMLRICKEWWAIVFTAGRLSDNPHPLWLLLGSLFNHQIEMILTLAPGLIISLSPCISMNDCNVLVLWESLAWVFLINVSLTLSHVSQQLSACYTAGKARTWPMFLTCKFWGYRHRWTGKNERYFSKLLIPVFPWHRTLLTK